MENGIKNKEVINSNRTKLKVAASFVFFLIIIFLLAFVSYSSFRKIVNSVESLSSNKDEATIIKQIASGMNEIRVSSKIYSITFKRSDLSIYSKNVNKVSALVDTLKLNLVKQADYKEADSLGTIFNEYILSLNRWLTIKVSGSNGDFKLLTEVVNREGDSLIHSSLNAPSSRTITVTKILEKANPDNSLKKNNSKLGFFDRIFRKKKKTEASPTPSLSVIKQNVSTEMQIQVDTNYYDQVDTLIIKMKNALLSTEQKKNFRKTKLAKLEVKLLNYQSALISEINLLLKNIEKKERAIIGQKVAQSKKMAREGSENLLYLEVGALLISVVFIYIIFSDITKSYYYKKMLEKAKLDAEKLAKDKQDFLANMSHEIRIPLTSIIGFSEQLEKTDLQSTQKQHVNLIVGSSEHLLTVVNDILDYSKIEIGSLKIEKIGFCIRDVLTDVIGTMQHHADRKGIKLLYELNADKKNIISGDPFRLKQVLINLVGNSIKFTEKGFVKIEVAFLKTNNISIVRFDIKDTGIGIEKDKIDDIFLGFSQGDGSITRKYGGTGLGLSISKKIVEMQNGRIWVNSQPGIGSVFSFEIPYLATNENEYKNKHIRHFNRGKELCDKKLLIVDDDDMVPVLLSPILQSWGIHCTFCNEPNQALALLKDNLYDLIMLDIQMPNINGFDLIRQIRSADQIKNKNISLIICTANVLIDESMLRRYAIPYELLFKPFKQVQLWSVFCRALNLKIIEEPEQGLTNHISKLQNYSLKNFKTYANEEIKILELFINTFISQTKKEVSLMSTLFLQKKYKEIAEVSHKISNTCGQLEAKEIIAILKYLEILTTTNNIDPKKIEQQLEVLYDALNKLFAQLEKELSDLDNNYKSIP